MRILLSLFHRCAGEVGLVGDGDGEVEARSTRSLSRLILEELELRVDESARETKASWSARTSSRRTSESEMRGVASWTSRISMNFEGISSILLLLCDGCGGGGGWRHQSDGGSRDLYRVHAKATWRQKGPREREIKTETETGKQFNTCRKGERQRNQGVGETKKERYWSMKGWTAVAPITLFGIGYILVRVSTDRGRWIERINLRHWMLCSVFSLRAEEEGAWALSLVFCHSVIATLSVRERDWKLESQLSPEAYAGAQDGIRCAICKVAPSKFVVLPLGPPPIGDCLSRTVLALEDQWDQ